MEEEVVAQEATEEEAVTPENKPANLPELSETETTPEEKTASALRRERRKEHERHLREENERLRAKVAELDARDARIDSTAKSMPEPQRAQFTDEAEYWHAKSAWTFAQQSAKFQQAEVSAEAEEHKLKAKQIEERIRVERVEAYNQGFPEARQKYADFDAVVVRAGENVSPIIADMVLAADQPTDLAYWLGSHVDVARSLSTMHPLDAARELGRIESRLSAPKPKTATSAPAPISTVKAAGSASKDPSDMNYEEFKAAWNAGKIR
jgi:hypothetical protein